MSAIFVLWPLLLGAGWIASPLPTQIPDTLGCTVTMAAGAKSKRCHVTVPAGRRVRVCAEADRQASRCDARVGKGRYVAWVVGTGPGRCRISKKKTRWDRVVAAKLSRSEGAPSTCTLHVTLE